MRVGGAPGDSAAALAARTEGWVAGLQLATLSLRGHTDPAGFVATFSGSHRYVLDYLTQEVLNRQPGHLVPFLLDTSVLERVSGPLCEAVTGRSDAQQLLEQIERANLFLHPFDEVRGWWRYHQLFADLLQARLHQQEPDRVAGLHRAAAGWCERHGLVDEAVRYALAAGDAVWAARLIERHFEALLQRAEDATLRRWLQALPAEAMRSRPRLSLAQGVWALIGGRLEAVDSLLDAAERAFAAADDEPYEPSVGRDASVVANVAAGITLHRAIVAYFRGDAEQAITLARQALSEVDQREWMLESATRWYLALGEWLRGQPVEAERALASIADSVAGSPVADPRTLASWRYHYLLYLGQVRRAQGRLGAALATYQEALEVVAEPGKPTPPAAGFAFVGMAEVAYQRGELDAAADHATQGVELSRQLVWTLPLVGGLAVLAQVRQAQGDQEGALEVLREAARVEVSPAVVGLLNPSPAVRARLALARGEVAEAARWVQECGLDAGDEPAYPREQEYLVLARVLLATPGLQARAGAVAATPPGGGRAAAGRQRHRGAGAAGTGACGPRRRARRAGRPRRGGQARRVRGLPAGVRGRGPANGGPVPQAAGGPAPGAGGRRRPA
jgi:LuxR family transcriptional regulator, maltose regulon positive regulatory protein